MQIGIFVRASWNCLVLSLLLAALGLCASLYAYAQVGDGTTTTRDTPVPANGLNNVVAVAGGYGHTLALLRDGTVRAWGYNFGRGLGDGTWIDRPTPVQVKGPNGVGFLTDVVAVAARHHSLALLRDGTVRAWGANNKYQLGDGTWSDRLTPVQVKGSKGVGFLTNVMAIAAGEEHSLAVSNDGTVRAWGQNDCGELGDGTTISHRTPVLVKGPNGVGFLTNVVAVAAGAFRNLALLNDGTVWAWGANSAGQLGIGSADTDKHPTPEQVSGLTNVVAVAAGSYHNLALLRDGTVMAWGYNGYGQLGDGTTTERHTPVPVSGLTNVMALAAGYGHSLALLRDGTVRAWGQGGALKAWGWTYKTVCGQLGDGTTINRPTPVQVKGPNGVGFLTNVVAVAAGRFHSLALLRDGTVGAWGWNGYGQLGDETEITRTIPVLVKGLNGVRAGKN